MGTFVILVIFCLIKLGNPQLPDSVILLQNKNGECSSIWNPEVKWLQDRDVFSIYSQTVEQDFYEADRNCVVTLVGKIGYQWEITVTKFDVEGTTTSNGIPVKCNDFVKLYDSERCDNAKLLKGVNFETGMCGTIKESEIGNLIFTTCANKLTIQFKTDIFQTFRRGFAMNLRQFPWSNPTGGPDCDPELNGIAAGVWRDGTFSEFQNTWNEQPIIPGYVPTGTETDYDKEINGVQCYECTSCPVEPFDPDKDGTAKASNCYVCSKVWDDEYYKAMRKCYTRTNYLSVIQSIREIDEPFLGCQKTADDFGRSVNYCFCDSDLCNKSGRMMISYLAMSLTLLISILHMCFL
ncbi:uncharacterized protein LOC123551631 [Mercenaria mercenaria]|uniref:uncharacterized protein LOC123551631 n=1 Tax=Mercenaria mercenaria TaxID=6596 RepID=UPI001E1D9039|nr:uncharacterized protein LOC123551631 [Mercenaria mercenaria]